MNCKETPKLRLLIRNEGKIKSFVSCFDLRAWSHDASEKDRYLKEWMRANTPDCVLPASSLNGILQDMTCGRRGKIVTRCHPNCKSKVILDCICASCNKMTKCIRHNRKFEKYFDEEEFESSNWPCDRCLDALKTIKLFWKVVAEKILNVVVSKDNSRKTRCRHKDGNSVKSIAKSWQRDMEQLTKNVTNGKGDGQIDDDKTVTKRRISCNTFTKSTRTRTGFCDSSIYGKYPDSFSSSDSLQHDYKDQEDDLSSIPSSVGRHQYTRNCRGRRSKIKVENSTGCGSFDLNNDDTVLYENRSKLRQDMEDQRVEVERLKKENHLLKTELKSRLRIPDNSCLRSPSHCTPIHLYADNDSSLSIMPFENIDDDVRAVKNPHNTDSEIIITMKNCKNQDYRNVSLLQVIHKTNKPNISDWNINTGYKKEDPIDLLNKVQSTFGAIVNREMDIANETKISPQKFDVDATYHSVVCSKSKQFSGISTNGSSTFVSYYNCL